VNPSRTIIGASGVLLALSAGLGVLNTQKTRDLRAQLTQARNAAEQFRTTLARELKEREAAVTLANARFGQTQPKVASTEGELIQAQRAALQAKLEDAMKQLDAAEREKALLSDKIRASREQSTQSDTEKKNRLPGRGNPGIRGTVLAVNQAYNFVVLSLGGRQGVELNSEMLVLRGGSFVGKIRISSVEPATAIGDIITSSLARGVQVQPGDIVIYAGTNS
jgi:hypothetical protein